MVAQADKPQTTALAPIERLKNILRTESVQEQFENALAENRGPFIASLIDIYGSDKGLQQCDPKLVVMEALKAAVLRLPINKTLGLAWIVPRRRNNVWMPQFQIGYKGYIQLAQRTGQYRYINADVLWEGETWSFDKLSGAVTLGGERTGNRALAYFAHIELLNGFTKTLITTTEEMLAHVERYCPSAKQEASAWKTHFDPMALKTVLTHLLGRYGILSIEMMNAIASDRDEADEAAFADEVRDNANGETIDVQAHTVEPGAEQSGPTVPTGPAGQVATGL